MKYVWGTARILLGLPLVLFGAMGLITVMPDPHAAWENQEGFAPEATSLILAMWDSGFLMHTVAAVHLVAGLLIVVNRFVPLALAVHLPVSIQMTLFHLCLDPGTGVIAYLVLILNVALMVRYRDSFRGLLVAKVQFDSSDGGTTETQV